MRSRVLSRRLHVLLLVLAAAASGAVFSHDVRAAWPPSAGANMADSANWPNDYHGEWNLSSSLPALASGTSPYLSADTSLGSAGMSIDRAWTLTTGSDEVRIAILDSGVQWEDPDLIENAWLNRAELRGDARPRKLDGTTCAGTGVLTGYDCNGDGRFTVSDYGGDLRFAPHVAGEPCFIDAARTQQGGDRLAGDLNRNCVLDAGDLILRFSDGVDDDGNGYTDDISGWDFVANDNDPYDDARSGHGSEGARAAVAAANNGFEIGACPTCRFVPVRVGESFFGDANDVAKGLLFATDTGASVADVAMTTLDQTPFSKAAIDYAYAHGTVVVASLGEENSNHIQMPATTNHTLLVNTVRYNGTTPESSTSFLSFDTCSNFGANLALSVSGSRCGSEGAGRAAGMLGLVHSYASLLGLRLTSEEAIQILKSSADDIDVAESRDATRSGSLHASKPGWDQRFGAGRANAWRALTQLKSGLIPPEVDIVSPEWFLPVFADRLGDQIGVRGRVAATRATSYDLAVEWAPGVEPDEAAFQQVVPTLKNLPASTISGTETPLAAFDPRAIDTTHTRDSDSLHGENDRTVTLRVRATAHYPLGDAKGEARRTISIVNEKNGADPNLLPGFPIHVDGSAEASPKIADVDGDGIGDIVYPTSDGLLHVFTLRTGAPLELEGFPFRSDLVDGLNPALNEPTLPNYLTAKAYRATGAVSPQLAREAFVSAPAVADIDGDGAVDIVVTSLGGTVYAVDRKGQLKSGWPKRLPMIPSCPRDPSSAHTEACSDASHTILRGAFASPIVVDVDGDGSVDVVQAAFDGRVYAWSRSGASVAGFPIVAHHPEAPAFGKLFATPTVADLNGDEVPDLIVASSEKIRHEGVDFGAIFAWTGRPSTANLRTDLIGWPIAVPSTSLLPLISEGLTSSPVAADFDRDGHADVVIQGTGGVPWIVSHAPGAHSNFTAPPNLLPKAGHGLAAPTLFGERSNAKSDSFAGMFSQPSVGDLDQDGVPDLVASGGSSTLLTMRTSSASARTAQHLLGMWNGRTGAMFPGSPFVLPDYTWFVNHAIADLTGDNYPEVISGSGANVVHAVDACGREASGFPKFTGGSVAASAAIGNIDAADSRALDVVVGTRTGYIFAWRTAGTLSGVVPWPSVHHDNANTGNYHTPLPTGSNLRASFPISCDSQGAVEEPRYEFGGCQLGRTARGSVSLTALSAALVLVRIRRRRRVSS